MNGFEPCDRIIGVYPTHRGFGYAILEVRGRLVSWGNVRPSTDTDEEFSKRFEALLDRYPCKALALESLIASKRGKKARKRIDDAIGPAKFRDVEIHFALPVDMRSACNLPEEATNYTVAARIAEMFPELQKHLPPKPTLWRKIEEQLAMFAAVGLVLGILPR